MLFIIAFFLLLNVKMIKIGDLQSLKTPDLHNTRDNYLIVCVNNNFASKLYYKKILSEEV